MSPSQPLALSAANSAQCQVQTSTWAEGATTSVGRYQGAQTQRHRADSYSQPSDIISGTIETSSWIPSENIAMQRTSPQQLRSQAAAQTDQERENERRSCWLSHSQLSSSRQFADSLYNSLTP
jgi:hypothetical protein